MSFTTDQLRTYRGWIAAGLAVGFYQRRPALLVAVERTSRLLNYSSSATSAHRWFTARLAAVRTRKRRKERSTLLYPPKEVLARVLEVYALIRWQTVSFPTVESEHRAVARAVLSLAKGHGQPGRLSEWRAAGRYIAQELAPFAIQFVRELESAFPPNEHVESPS